MFGGVRRFWLSRDDDVNADYNIHTARRGEAKPRMIDIGGLLGRVYHTDVIETFCSQEFEDLFPNCKLEPGQARRVKITVEGV